MRELTLEQRISRLERIINSDVYNESLESDMNADECLMRTSTRKTSRRDNEYDEDFQRTDELFGGLIGAVNADKKDCQKVAAALKADPLLRRKTDIKACEYMFDLSVCFACDNTYYEIKIKDTKNSKITVALYKDGKNYYEDIVKGLRMNTSAIVKAVKGLVNKVSKGGVDIEKASECSSREIRLQLDREDRERQAQWEREREAIRKKSYDDDSKSKKKSSDRVSSSRDWYDINPYNNSEVDGYEYGRL